MAEVSAGILVWRRGAHGPEFLLVHPGGPYWRGKDAAGWSIPKGLIDPQEEPLAAARREFLEETGQSVDGTFLELAPCRTPSGKVVRAWLVEADLDLGALKSNLFEMEWPPRSGRRQSFPEVDRAGWFEPQTALAKIHKGQQPLLLDAIRRLEDQDAGSSRS